ncbi:MAG: glycosyltransferase family 9 protein [Candidatus Eremiobacteraeota bacterium]|nr:glycosyltransferase family 9 protein [Candidatus Eremiobacteraeota bacterium]
MHVLAVRQDNNGDVLLVGPALRALAARARVTLICSPHGEGAARLLPGVDRVIVASAAWIDANPRPIDRDAVLDYVARVRALGADEAFVFTSFHQSPLPAALLLRMAGVPRVHAICEDYAGSLLDTRLRLEGERHESQRALSLVGAAGFLLPGGDDGALRIKPPGTSPVAGSYVAVQPGATVPARAWSSLRYRELVQELCARGVRVVVLGSPDETEVARFVTGESDAQNLAGQTTFAEFAATIAEAQALVVGNSSGIHLASAVGTPVVTVFPPTILPQRFAPWRVAHVMLGDHAISCAGCRARVCPIPGQPCIGKVTAGDVLAALQRLGVQLPERAAA